MAHQEDMQVVNFRLSRQQHMRLRLRLVKQRKSLQALYAMLTEQWLAEEERHDQAEEASHHATGRQF